MVPPLFVFMVVAIFEVISIFLVVLRFEVVSGSRWSSGVVLEFGVVSELVLICLEAVIEFEVVSVGVNYKVSPTNRRSRLSNSLNIIFLFQNNYGKLI